MLCVLLHVAGLGVCPGIYMIHDLKARPPRRRVRLRHFRASSQPVHCVLSHLNDVMCHLQHQTSGTCAQFVIWGRGGGLRYKLGSGEQAYNWALGWSSQWSPGAEPVVRGRGRIYSPVKLKQF